MTFQDKINFIEKYMPACVLACRGTGIFPEIKMAQLILETGWGRSIIKAAKNLFGIKADPKWTGQVISNSTHEVLNGKKTLFKGTGRIYKNRAEAIISGAHIQTLFRAYNSEKDSIYDHSRFLLTNSRYKAALNAKTAYEQADLLLKAGYATAPNYASALKSIIKQYKLDDAEKKKQWEAMLNMQQY